MNVKDKEYQEHPVFADIDNYSEFYKALAIIVLPWITDGTRALGNLDTYVYSSIQGTLSSMSLILRDGRINDAFCLLRKFYDSAIINVYTNLFLKNEFEIDNFIVRQVDDWRRGTAQLPEYRIMSQYIRKSDEVSPISDLLFVDSRYSKIRDRCNDNTHFNFYKNVLLNDNLIHLPARQKAIDSFENDLRDLVIMHLSLLFCISPHYMMSTDYIDAAECGVTPDPDSQYWVAPFIQKIYSDVIKKNRPDVAQKLKEITDMQLE